MHYKMTTLLFLQMCQGHIEYKWLHFLVKNVQQSKGYSFGYHTPMKSFQLGRVYTDIAFLHLGSIPVDIGCTTERIVCLNMIQLDSQRMYRSVCTGQVHMLLKYTGKLDISISRLIDSILYGFCLDLQIIYGQLLLNRPF